MKKRKVLYSIKEIRSNKSIRSSIPSNAGVYQWWCKEKLLKEILTKLDIEYNECLDDLEKTNNVLVNSKMVENKMFYCAYVGDTIDLKRRLCSNHINGRASRSTLRKTIAAVLLRKIDEICINDYIDKFYIEWQEYKKCEYHCEQNRRINEYFRPLNNKDILSSCNKYTAKRHYEVTKNGKSKKSNKITQLRSLI